MDLHERSRAGLEQIEDQEMKIREHIESLENLENTTSFNLDIASDINPNLIDVRSPEGVAQAQFYKDLYNATKENMHYIAIGRFEMGIPVGTCTGFGAEPKYDITNAYLRIYRDLPESAIQFLDDEDGKRVVINHASTIFSRQERRRDTHVNPNVTVLFDQSRHNYRELLEQHVGTPIIRSQNRPSGFETIFEQDRRLRGTTIRSNAFAMAILQWQTHEIRALSNESKSQ